MLNELYTFAEPVQVVPFSSLKWGKFTLLHTTRLPGHLRLHLMTTHVKTTGTASYMIACRQLRASPYARNTAYRCLFRAHSSDGSRNRIHTWKIFSEQRGHQGLILSRPLQITASSFHWDPMPHALTPTLSSGFIGQSTTAILMKESQCSRHSEWLPIMAHTRPSTRRKEAVLKQVR